MKIAIITDQHFGARNDSIHFLDYYEKFYRDTFFPTLDNNGITNLLILGDTFDRRKYVNFLTLKRTKEMFFDELYNRDIKVSMLAGNHDTYFKNTNDVNSVDLLLKQYPNVHVIDKVPSGFILDDSVVEVCSELTILNLDNNLVIYEAIVVLNSLISLLFKCIGKR